MPLLVIASLWCAFALLVYTYVGYPLLLAAWARFRPRPWHRGPIVPTVTIVVAAWNEGPRLKARITNLLEQDYPSIYLDVVVVSDGSTDATDEVLRQVD